MEIGTDLFLITLLYHNNYLKRNYAQKTAESILVMIELRGCKNDADFASSKSSYSGASIPKFPSFTFEAATSLSNDL